MMSPPPLPPSRDLPVPVPVPVPSNPGLIEREKRSLKQHRLLTLHGSAFPPPRSAPRGTFMHGFLLPFSLIVATLRHPTLGISYLKLTVVRAVIVAACAAFVFAGPAARNKELTRPGSKVIVVRRDKGKGKRNYEFAKEIGSASASASGSAAAAAPPTQEPVHVDVPGVKVDIDPATGERKAVVLGKEFPIVDDQNSPPPKPDEASLAKKPSRLPAFLTRAIDTATAGWEWFLWFIGIVSATEGFVVFFSRRWDDWISFYASSIARIRPEDPVPPPKKIAFDFAWLIRKFKRRIRGYLVFGAGIPLLALLRLTPGHINDVKIGNVLFSIALTFWGWYWLAVFTAGKSAHAWADGNAAEAPFVIRGLRDRPGTLFGPVRLYGRIWARITRSMNPAASTFERNPRPFLGLALARVILSLPGLYLLARPIVPIASGRLCAESDPADRFSTQG